ncbi:uncharacterized protein LOC114540270 [Dendronephthya gigantea]|uniref:uncharacterized protein LOC114538525 n=1 Tax=Dendronephthya gigantea TaxID=151771 RepID=UPI001069E782|nr:uncharacterized protein LOC114538525 [Dendronephthya gigantea]XP_028416345.1 uncharacterized protein LOC114540270 [Dendronephthya gigantea]
MNHLALFCFLLNVSGVFMAITLSPGMTSTTYKRSCLEIKTSAPNALSGLYDILVDNTVIAVYCEMARAGGGYTFIPREAVRRSKLPSLIRQIFKKKTKVLFRFQKKDGLQPFTVITQLSRYSRQKIGVLMHNYVGYTRPLNAGLGDYIYVGILPASIARARIVQGFRSNGRSVNFTSCGSSPNSFFAFFPNHREIPINGYHSGNLVYEQRGVAVDWRNTGIPSYGHRQMPNNFFFLTEIHFGGCGTYTSSDRWTDAFGTAIGLR